RVLGMTGTIPIAGAKPAVLFLCVHNAGRSQMAAGFLRHLGDDRIEVLSGGSTPASEVNPAAVAAMAERGVDIAAAAPRRWADSDLERVDVVVTMGCGDECPYVPGTVYEDWPLDDPAGQGVDAVRPIRDEIEQRVRDLMGRLGVAPADADC
ncbi:MAG: arsenate reductase ArsC, partial [Acidimicrobiales bacterium]